MSPALVFIAIVITGQRKNILTAWLVDVSGARRTVKPVGRVSGAHTYVAFLTSTLLFMNNKKFEIPPLYINFSRCEIGL